MKKRILGITALLAVLALGMAFIACPIDEEEREVIFENHTAVPMTVICEGTPANLPLAAGKQSDAENDTWPRGTVTRKGKDIKLLNIAFGGSGALFSDNWTEYVELGGAAAGSVTKAGIELKAGIITFNPVRGDKGGPPFGFKISTIPLDE